jgi:hypothetical protein
MSEVATGGCLCGAVKYNFERANILSAHHCHCTDCQKSTGSGKATVIFLPTPALELSGELKYYTVTGTDGAHISRGFCPQCGSPVISFIEEMPDARLVKAGTLDDSSWLEIDSNLWSDSAQAWSPVDPDHPGFAQNPDM